MVKTPQSHCGGHGFDPLVGELRSCMPHSTAKKKKKAMWRGNQVDSLSEPSSIFPGRTQLFREQVSSFAL